MICAAVNPAAAAIRFESGKSSTNFEVGCILHTPRLVEELEARFEQDLADSVRLDPDAFARRSLLLRVTENACRLFSPVL